MNPYLLDTPAVVNLSGGRSSGFMTWHILQAYGGQLPPDVQCVFQNTGLEREETLAFVNEMSRRWSLPVVWVEYRVGGGFEVVTFETASRDGRPFRQLVHDRNFLPNPRARICTIELKILTCDRYLRSLGWEHWTSAIGFRADEPARVAKLANNAMPHEDKVTPMAKAGVTRQQVMDFWAAQPFDLGLESYESNCSGCFMKKRSELAAIFRKEPALAEPWIEMEETGVTDKVTGLPKPSRFRNDRQSYRVQLEMAQSPTIWDAVDDEPDEMAFSCFCSD